MRLLPVLMALGLAFSVVACGDDSEPTTPAQQDAGPNIPDIEPIPLPDVPPVTDPDVPPTGDELTVAITADPQSGNAPLGVTFTSTVTGGESPYTYAWDFGDGETSDQASPSHSYGDAGTYTAELTVTDAAGDTDSEQVTVTVTGGSNPDPLVVTNVTATPRQGVAPLDVTFSATVVGGTTPYTYAWDFDDDNTATDAEPTNTFAAAGTYTVDVTVTDADGTTARGSVDVTVIEEGQISVMVFADPTSGEAPLDVAFTSEVVGAESPSYAWDFGDGNTSTDANPSHTFADAGTYEVTLTVTDGENEASDSISITVVSPGAFVVEISATPTDGMAPLGVHFTSTLIGGVAPFTYAWDFGGLGTAATESADFTFNDPGSYQVILSVTDSEGNTASDSVTIAVGAADELVVSIDADPTAGPAPLAVQFNANVTGGTEPYRYEWNFGMGATSTEANPAHTFQLTGSYHVALTVTDSSAPAILGSADIMIEVTAAGTVTASIQADPLSGTAPLSVNFHGTAVGGTEPYNFAWDFGDGQTGEGATLSHTYTRSGRYDVVLTATDNATATDDATVTITVGDVATPVVSASASPTTGTAPLRVNFTCTVSGGDAPVTVAWDFGNGSTGTGATARNTYMAEGDYTATCTATDATGDTDSDSVLIVVSTVTAGCSILAQDCNDGEKCSLGLNGYECMPAGTVGAGDPCGTAGEDDCQAGLICVGAGAEFYCETLCMPDSMITGCDTEAICITIDATLNAGICLPWVDECSILDQDCPDGNMCSLGPDGIQCVPEGNVAPGEACGLTATDDCTAGYICVGYGEDFSCESLCEPFSADTGCADGEVCYDLMGEDINFGYCGEPIQLECSIVNQDCDEGLKCVGMCIPAGALTQGEECGATGWDDCAAGLLCVGYGDVYTCEPICDPNATPNGCETDWECAALDQFVGICLPPFVEECSIAAQDCPDGDRCFFGELGIQCIPPGPMGLGEECGMSGEDDCGVGLICVGFGTNFTCEPICEPESDPTGCPDGMDCYALVEGLNLGVCDMALVECTSVLAQDCPDGNKCIIGGDALMCWPEGNIGLDEECSFDTDECQAGLMCVGYDTTFWCAQLCEPYSAITGCDEGFSCEDTFDMGQTVNAGMCWVELTEDCSVVDQDCPDGQRCTYIETGLGCAPDGTVAQGDECGLSGADDCMAGLVCLGDGTTFTCQPFCEPYSTSTGCLGVCMPLDEVFNAGYCIPLDVDPNCASILEDTCPGEQKCTMDLVAEAITCVDGGDRQLGQVCNMETENCAAGLICLGTCEPLCEPFSPATGCDEGQSCALLISEDFNVGLCVDFAFTCSPAGQDCDAGMKCSFGETGIECVPDGTVAAGEVCGLAEDDDCVAGYICAGIDPNFICIPLCEPYSDPDGCEGGTTCEGLYGLEGMNIGVCE